LNSDHCSPRVHVTMCESPRRHAIPRDHPRCLDAWGCLGEDYQEIITVLCTEMREKRADNNKTNDHCTRTQCPVRGVEYCDNAL